MYYGVASTVTREGTSDEGNGMVFIKARNNMAKWTLDMVVFRSNNVNGIT